MQNEVVQKVERYQEKAIEFESLRSLFLVVLELSSSANEVGDIVRPV
jgi:hypothetical protein